MNQTRPDSLPEAEALFESTKDFNAFRTALPETEALVPVENVEWLRERIAKISKRAAKLRVEPPRLNILAVVLHQYKSQPIGISPAYVKPVLREARYAHVRIEGEAPNVPGYDLVGVVNHQHSETTVKAVPGQETPEDARERAGDCDHCRKKRARLNTYILRHQDTGEIRYVGSNCLADFLGGHDPKAAIRWAEMLSSLCGEAREVEYNGPRAKGFQLHDLLPMVAACIRTHGWISRSRARNSYDNETATVDQAWSQLNPQARKAMREEDRVYIEAEDLETVEKALQWAEDLDADDPSEYIRNIRVIARDGWALWNEDGFAASIVSSYQRHMDKLAEAERKARLPKSEFFGEVGVRADFRLTVTHVRVFDGYYGTTYCYRFVREDSGDRAVWFASRDQELRVDETYTVKATVKEHKDDDRYGRQTQLTRGKVL